MSRNTRQIPFANWLTSRDPALRERAETALYHLGPDGGTALFDAAERVTLPAEYLSISCALLLGLTLQSIFGWIIVSALRLGGLASVVVWLVALGNPILFALNRLVRLLLSRRGKLKVLGLALAKRNDLRAIGPLLEAWRPLNAFQRQRPDDEIEHELARLMPLFLRQKSFDLRTYKKRHLRQKTWRLFSRRIAGLQMDASLSDQRADVVVTVLQILSRSTSEQDRALLERISRLQATSPNSLYVRDAALFCLKQPVPVITPAALDTAGLTQNAGVAAPNVVGSTPVVARRF